MLWLSVVKKTASCWAESLQLLTQALGVQVSLLQALAGGPVPMQALDGRPLQVTPGLMTLLTFRALRF